MNGLGPFSRCIPGSQAKSDEREECLEILFHVSGIGLIALLASGRESIDGARLYPSLAFLPCLPASLAIAWRSIYPYDTMTLAFHRERQ